MEENSAATRPSKFTVGGDRQNELFEVLAHPRRRFVLQYLQTTDTPLLVDKMATELVARDGHRTVSPRSSDGKKAVEMSLAHSHLPKLDDTGFVQYDATRGTVALAERADEVWTHLESMPSD